MPLSYRAAQNLIKRGDEPGLRAALASGLDPNLTNHNGWSLLMLAAVEGTPALAAPLLSSGAKINAANRHGETALSLAAQKGHLALLHLLLQHGASKDCRPHGTALPEWLATGSGLPEPKLSEVLQLIADA